ncbi:alpha-amylase family glycosyl hydrolase [Haliangium ochraceum]|nr:alpha-amylase family glycosyl hydrolase [Haliangium ochraceum]
MQSPHLLRPGHRAASMYPPARPVSAPATRARSPRLTRAAAALLALLGLGACGGAPATQQPSEPGEPPVASEPDARPGSFADNPLVYFVITDRFFDGNAENNHSYGRKGDGGDEIGTFHGGDLAGLTTKLEEGYFRALGVNAIWITAPYEQIRGWVVGGDKAFQHYSYHGYYTLDYTVLDQNMGTPDELRRFVDTAHEQDIRVIFDVVMNHPGYADLQTLDAFDIEVLWEGWESATLSDYHSYIDYNNFAFTEWWGPDWIRAGLPGYQEGNSTDDLTMQLAYLPDFKTESEQPVGLPPFLTRKADTKAVAVDGYTVRDYLVAWLSAWVREYGIDGFRCDTAKHVELAAWSELKQAGTEALAAWKQDNPGKAIDDAPFWMTGEVFPHGVVRDAYFDQGGFDNLINFDFQNQLGDILRGPASERWQRLDDLYADYAAQISDDASFNVLSYISSHDTKLFDREALVAAGTALLLAPGGVQIFYGDESARPLGPSVSSDPQQNTRSDMNWDALADDVLAHWQTLGRFRRRHVALAKGTHQKLGDAPYVFARSRDDDAVVVALLGQLGEAGADASETVRVPVGDVFPVGTRLRDAATGAPLEVETDASGGAVALTPGASGVVLLERVAP